MNTNNDKSPTIRLIELKYQKDIVEIIKDLFNECKSSGNVAKRLGISRQYLWTITNKLGIRDDLPKSQNRGGRPTWQEANKKAWKQHQTAQ